MRVWTRLLALGYIRQAASYASSVKLAQEARAITDGVAEPMSVEEKQLWLSHTQDMAIPAPAIWKESPKPAVQNLQPVGIDPEVKNQG
jgi:hypothetical protein